MTDMKATYNNMMDLMMQMSRKIDGMSPPRKRSAISPHHDISPRHDNDANDADAESNSASMDTTLSGHSQLSIISNGSNFGEEIPAIQDLSEVQHDPTDLDCTMQSDHLRSPDFPRAPPPC
jgi:hypothetical protein